MKTWFQYSRKRSVSSPGRSPGPPNCSPRSKYISEHGPQGPVGPRLPEVLRARQLDDPLVGHADPAPDLDRLRVGPEAELLVAGEDRDPDPLRVEAEALGRELPAPGDRLLLEVVAEAPVAEHLEEGQVAGRVADLLDVGGAEALLHVGDARRRRLGLAEEVGLERLHARRRQQHRGVVRGGHQRGRGDDLVAALLEEAQERLADLVGLHPLECFKRAACAAGSERPADCRPLAAALNALTTESPGWSRSSDRRRSWP